MALVSIMYDLQLMVSSVISSSAYVNKMQKVKKITTSYQFPSSGLLMHQDLIYTAGYNMMMHIFVGIMLNTTYLNQLFSLKRKYTPSYSVRIITAPMSNVSIQAQCILALLNNYILNQLYLNKLSLACMVMLWLQW